MKRLFYTLCILMLTLTGTRLAAQELYIPFVVEGKVWEVCVGKYYPQEAVKWGTSYVKTYYIKGDTLIGGRTCKKVYTYDLYETLPARITPTTLYACIYEENKRVYLIAPGSETPGLLYDFGLEEGKSAAFRLVDYRDAQRTVGSVFTAINRDYVNHVAGIDYRLIDREVLRTKYSCAPENPNIPNSQIWCYEGVGSVDGPLSTLLEDVNPEEVAVPYDVRCLVNNVPLYGLFTSVEIGATSIAPPTRTDRESLIFDLSGRRLTEKPEHGIYIQNGRTHIAE